MAAYQSWVDGAGQDGVALLQDSGARSRPPSSARSPNVNIGCVFGANVARTILLLVAWTASSLRERPLGRRRTRPVTPTPTPCRILASSLAPSLFSGPERLCDVLALHGSVILILFIPCVSQPQCGQAAALRSRDGICAGPALVNIRGLHPPLGSVPRSRQSAIRHMT